MKIKQIIALERLRKELLGKRPMWKFLSFIGAIAATTVLFLAAWYNHVFLFFAGFEKIKFNFVFIAIVIFLIINIFIMQKQIYRHFCNKNLSKFNSEYKEFYLKPYVESLGFYYEKNGYVSDYDIIRSGLFAEFDAIDGNDKISGKIGNVCFSFSDLKLEKKADYAKQNFFTKQNITIFQGLLFVANFKKQSRFPIKILPNTILMQPNMHKISMDNALFNDTFNVFCKDAQNAMYILTPRLMERIIFLRKMVKCNISISFLGNNIFIKIDKGYDSFEPNLEKKIVTSKLTSSIKKELDVMFEIVKILKLNEKIWLK